MAGLRESYPAARGMDHPYDRKVLHRLVIDLKNPLEGADNR
jgi:hypothetical protein